MNIERIRSNSINEYELPSNIQLSQSNEIKWINEDDIDYPNCLDMICYYFKSLFNNNKNKLQYLIFKSKTYTLINRGAVLLSYVQDVKYFSNSNINNDNYLDNDNNLDCICNNSDIDIINIDTEIINIFQLADQYLKENSKILGLSQAPFKEFMEHYFYKRNILLKLDDTYKNKYTNNRFIIAKRTTYIINQLEVLFEFIKTSVDNNDQLPYKLIILIMNFIIVLGEYLFKYYWIDNSKNC